MVRPVVTALALLVVWLCQVPAVAQQWAALDGEPGVTVGVPGMPFFTLRCDDDGPALYLGRQFAPAPRFRIPPVTRMDFTLDGAPAEAAELVAEVVTEQGPYLYRIALSASPALRDVLTTGETLSLRQQDSRYGGEGTSVPLGAVFRDLAAPFFADCPAGTAVAAATPAPAPLPAPAGEVPNAFDAAHRKEAQKRIATLDCQPGADVAYCADPDILALRQRLEESAAAAIARMPMPAQRLAHGQEVAPAGRNQARSTLYRLAWDREALADVLVERIALWDRRQTAQDPDAILRRNTASFACRGALAPWQRILCADTAVAERHAALWQEADKLAAIPRASRDGAPLVAEVMDPAWEPALMGACAERACIEAAFEARAKALAAFAATVAERLAAIEAEAEARREAAQYYTVGPGLGASHLIGRFEPVERRTNLSQQALARETEVAAFEAALAEESRETGTIYRNLGFWAHFRDPGRIRSLFRGNATFPDDPRFGGTRGILRQVPENSMTFRLYAIGYAAAFEAQCGHLIPPDAREWAPTQDVQVTTFRPVPLGRRSLAVVQETDTYTQVVRRIRLEPDFAPAFFAMLNRTKGGGSGLAYSFMSSLDQGLAGVDALIERVQNEIAEASGDMADFFAIVGCDSPSAYQMRASMISLSYSGYRAGLWGKYPSIAGRDEISDRVLAPGEIANTAQACWAPRYGNDGGRICGCVGRALDRAAAQPGSPVAQLGPTARWESYTKRGSLARGAAAPFVAAARACAR